MIQNVIKLEILKEIFEGDVLLDLQMKLADVLKIKGEIEMMN